MSHLSQTKEFAFFYQGLVVQNLTKLLANMALKFLSWNMENTRYIDIFCWKKLVTFLQQKYQCTCIWKYLSYSSLGVCH